MTCGGFSLVGIEGSDAGVFPFRCKRWGCTTCGPKKAKATMARISAGMKLGPTKFFTLTSPGNESAADSYAAFPKRWKLFHQRLERRFGRIEYLAVVEPQKRGAAHVHVVYRGPFIPQRVLSRMARESGFGPIADIRQSNKRLMRYLAKYLTKQLGSSGDEAAPVLPRHFRRVRWSSRWCDWQKREPSRYATWYISDGQQLDTAADAKRRGLTVVELVVSETAKRWPQQGPIRWVRTLSGYRPWSIELPGAAA